jgi:ferrochelatase
LTEAVEATNPQLHVEFVESWHDNDELIAAFTEKVTAALDRTKREADNSLPVVFTAHSVPQRTIEEGDPYQAQVMETARLIAQRAALDNWRVAFQSQGMSPEPWIGPTVESQIDLLAGQGHRHLLLVPVSFVSDHVEILYDVDIAFREYGKAKGVSVWRSESLNESPLLTHALLLIASARMHQAG